MWRSRHQLTVTCLLAFHRRWTWDVKKQSWFWILNVFNKRDDIITRQLILLRKHYVEIIGITTKHISAFGHDPLTHISATNRIYSHWPLTTSRNLMRHYGRLFIAFDKRKLFARKLSAHSPKKKRLYCSCQNRSPTWVVRIFIAWKWCCSAPMDVNANRKFYFNFRWLHESFPKMSITNNSFSPTQSDSLYCHLPWVNEARVYLYSTVAGDLYALRLNL